MAGGEEAVRVVFLWMETTGFDPPVRPLQISAIGKSRAAEISDVDPDWLYADPDPGQ